MDRRRSMSGSMAVLATTVVAVAAASVATAATPSADWPTFKGDAARNGVGLDGPTGDPVVRWTYQADGPVNEQVVIGGGLAYFASEGDGVLHALDVGTGIERWRYAPDAEWMTGPSVFEGSVYFYVAPGQLVSLDAATGAERWVSDARLSDPTGPTFGDAALFTGTVDGQLVAIEAADGSERWRTAVAEAPVHRPAFADGAVFAGTESGEFLRVGAGEGSVDWRFPTGMFQTGTPVVADGVAYVGAANYHPNGDGRLWAVDAATGELRWQLDEPIHVPVVVDGIGYTGSLGLGVSAHDLTDGSRLWTFPVETGFIRPLAVAEGVVYVPTDDDNRIHAIDATDGTELWQFQLDTPTDCCVGVAEGAVFVGTWGGQVLAIGGDDDITPTTSVEPVEPVEPSPGALMNPYAVIGDLDPATTGLEGAGAVDIGPDGKLYVVDSKPSVTVLSPDGTVLESWGSHGAGDGQLDFTGRIPSIAVGADGLVYVAEGGNHRISVFQPDGTFVRHIGAFGDDPGRFVAPLEVFVDREGGVYVVDDTNLSLSKFDTSGAFQWRIGGPDETDTDLQGHFHRGALASDGRVWVTTDDPSRLIALDPADGRKMEAIASERGIGPGAFVIGACALELDAQDNAHVIDCTDRRMNVFDPAHRPIATWEAAPETLPFGLSYAIGPDGRMYAVAGGDRANGGTVASPDSIIVVEVDLPTAGD